MPPPPRSRAAAVTVGLPTLLLLVLVCCCHAFLSTPSSGPNSFSRRLPLSIQRPSARSRLYSLDEKGVNEATTSTSASTNPPPPPPPPAAAVSRPRARGLSTPAKDKLDINGLLKRRLGFVMETVGDIDRAALYITRRDLVRGGVDLVPAVVLPSAEEEWMFSQVSYVQQKKRRSSTDVASSTFLLPTGHLGVRISYGPQLVAVLVVDDENRRRSRRKKEGENRNEVELKLSAARMSRIEEVASRVFGLALKDILVSDDDLLAAPPPSSLVVRREVVPFNRLSTETILAEPAVIDYAGKGSEEEEEGGKKEKDVTPTTPLGPNFSGSYIPSASVTTSVGGNANITFDLHLVEDFKHLFDDIYSSGMSMENSTNLVILKIAAPVVAALALEPLISLVDTYYVGQYLGPISLSAYGVSERVFVFSLYVLNFLATSTTPIVANLRAQGQEEAARELVGRLLFFAGMFGLILIPILQTLSYPLLNLLGARPENYVEAVEYFQVRSWGTPALMLVAVSNGALRGYLDTTTPLIVAAIAFVVDYSVDPQVVYPADPKGLGAAGAATVVAEWLSAGLFLGKFLTMKPAILPILDFFPPWAEMAPVVRAGTQIFIRTVLLQGLLATSCIAAARIGPLDIAAHQVALQLWIPPSFITDAFSIAAQGLVADALGRGDRVRARELSQYLLKWGVALGGVLAVFCATAQIVYPDALPHFFTDDQGILDKVHPIVWLIAIMQPINGLVNVGAGVLQGAQDFTYQVLTMGLSAVFAGSLFFILRDEGLTAVWETLLAFQMMRALLFAYRFVEPLGPLAIKQRKEQKVLVGSTMDMWWNKNDSRTRKKKKKRRWFD